jgi:hypothetical protein
LSSALGAVDWGFRVILVTDALGSSVDEIKDAIADVYENKFGEQVERSPFEALLESRFRTAEGSLYAFQGARPGWPALGLAFHRICATGRSLKQRFALVLAN